MSATTLTEGSVAPDFELPGVDGEEHSLEDFDAEALVVVFTCNHCPVAQDYEDRIVAIQDDYDEDELQVVAINPNDDEQYPDDDFENMVERAEEAGFNFPYLRDESQDVAEAYGPTATPHFFVFDGDRELVYEGALDDDRDPEDASVSYVHEAVDAVLAGEDVDVEGEAARGCSIKWKQAA